MSAKSRLGDGDIYFEDAVRQRCMPRKPGSVWSKVNIALAESLIAQGCMTPAD